MPVTIAVTTDSTTYAVLNFGAGPITVLPSTTQNYTLTMGAHCSAEATAYAPVTPPSTPTGEPAEAAARREAAAAAAAT